MSAFEPIADINALAVMHPPLSASASCGVQGCRAAFAAEPSATNVRRVINYDTERYRQLLVPRIEHAYR
jgi:hypothetical protein